MEFHEKLQHLRKSKGITQEELADALFVSRTAVSKWESGRGYPSIDSLKAVAAYFDVSIDDLLSCDKIIFIAENEKKNSINDICNLLFSVMDICMLFLAILPLYPCVYNGFVYSVNLFVYTDAVPFKSLIYWILVVSVTLCGVLKILLTRFKVQKGNKILMTVSLCLGIITVLVLIISREGYGASLAFLLLAIKVLLVFKQNR